MGADFGDNGDTDIAIGSVLDGRYRIDAILGAGGMGRVYRGEHTGIGRAVAIKVLHADLSRNKEAAQRFQREALASGRLDHPNIVGVSDFGIVDDGPCYLVMEALEGESLGSRLQRDKRIHWREALEILRGVLHGLRHAHERGVVHRDIKPDNIFLARKDGMTVVKILDFGIAKLYAGSADDPASTRTGLTVGTPAYLSPEQAVGGEIKPASDLYSSTIVLFEMIVGHPPFEDKDPLAMLGAHVSRPPPRVSEAVPGLECPEQVEDLIQRGLAKTTAERITSAAEYLTYVDAIVGYSGPTQQPFANEVTPFPPTSMPLGHAPTASFTPLHATPMPTPMPGHPTPLPMPTHATPLPMHATPLPMRASTAPVSLADAPPIPRNWIKVGAIVVAALVIIAVLFALAGGGGGSKPRAPAPAKPEPKAAAPAPPPEKTVEPTPAPPPPTLADLVTPGPDSATRLKDLVAQLQNGKTCPDRKAAVAGLADLGDSAAIPHLRRARFRMRGGLAGFGQSNTNACLKAAAEAAIKQLGGTVK